MIKKIVGTLITNEIINILEVISRKSAISVKFLHFHGKRWIYVKCWNSRDLGGETIDLAFIFILFRGKCGNNIFR